LMTIGFGFLLGIMLVLAVQTLDGHARGDHWSRLAKYLPRGRQFNREVAVKIRTSLSSHVASHPDDADATIELIRLSVDLARFDVAKAASSDLKSADWIENYHSLAPSTLRSIWYSQAKTSIAARNDEFMATANSTNLDNQSASLLPYHPKGTAHDELTTDSLAGGEVMTVEDQRLAYGTALHQARDLAVRALLHSPLSGEIQRELVGLDFAGGNSKQSEVLIDSLINLRRKHGESLLFAGQLAAQARLWKVAASAWAQAMAIQPALTSAVIASLPLDSPVSLASILPNDARVLAIAAQQELSKNKPDVAILTRASELLERSRPTERSEQMQQLRLLARIHAKRGQPKLAAESLGKVIAISPGDLELRYQYALMLRESGNIHEARRQARAGRQIAPTDTRFDQLITAMSRGVEGQAD